MSRFQSELNAQQKEQYLSPQKEASPPASKSGHVLSLLDKNDFHICDIVESDMDVRIRLGCGAVITVYTTGTVLVQGQIYGYGSAEAEKILREILPTPFVWKARVDR